MWGNDEFARVLQKVGSTNLESGIKVGIKKRNELFFLFFYIFWLCEAGIPFLQVCKRQNFSKKTFMSCFCGEIFFKLVLNGL